MILMMVVMHMEMTGILAMLRAVPQMEPKLAGIRQAMMVVAEAEKVHQAIMTQRAGTTLMMVVMPMEMTGILVMLRAVPQVEMVVLAMTTKWTMIIMIMVVMRMEMMGIPVMLRAVPQEKMVVQIITTKWMMMTMVMVVMHMEMMKMIQKLQTIKARIQADMKVVTRVIQVEIQILVVLTKATLAIIPMTIIMVIRIPGMLKVHPEGKMTMVISEAKAALEIMEKRVHLEMPEVRMTMVIMEAKVALESW